MKRNSGSKINIVPPEVSGFRQNGVGRHPNKRTADYFAARADEGIKTLVMPDPEISPSEEFIAVDNRPHVVLYYGKATK